MTSHSAPSSPGPDSAEVPVLCLVCGNVTRISRSKLQSENDVACVSCDRNLLVRSTSESDPRKKRTRDLERAESVAKLLDALSSPKRLIALRAIREGKSAKAIAEECGLTRQGLQNHLQHLMHVELIEHGEDQTYVVTARGAMALDVADNVERLNYSEMKQEELVPLNVVGKGLEGNRPMLPESTQDMGSRFGGSNAPVPSSARPEGNRRISDAGGRPGIGSDSVESGKGEKVFTITIPIEEYRRLRSLQVVPSDVPPKPHFKGTTRAKRD